MSSGYLSVYQLGRSCSREVFRTPHSVVQVPKGAARRDGNTSKYDGQTVTSLHYSAALNSILLTSYDNNVLFLQLQDYTKDNKMGHTEITNLPVWKMVS